MKKASAQAHKPSLSEMIPLEKLTKQIEKCTDNSKQKVVLVGTGCYSPVHRMHIHVLDVAKKYLEESHNMAVVGGFISPSHDCYAAEKLGDEGIKAIHRVAMIELAVSSSDWICASSWESLGNKDFVSIGGVLHAIDSYIQTKIQTPIRIIYVCGADLILRCGGIDRIGKYNIVAVGRHGYSEKLKSVMAIAPKLYFIAEDTENISSTQIRDRIRNKQTIDDLTFPGVTQYLEEHKADLNVRALDYLY